MIFIPEQIEFFQSEGYLIASRFFNAEETAALQNEIERFKREGLLHNVRTEGDGKTLSSQKQNLQLCPMSPHSRLFKAFPFHPKVTAAVAELIGDPVVLHLDQVFLKPARHGTGTSWHQDNGYFEIPDPLKGTALWTAVHDANLDNGTLEVIPGSFRESLPHSRDPESNHHVRCYPDESQTVPAILEAGGVIFFAYGTAHCTRANRTDKDRAGAAFHFLNADYVPADYFSTHNGNTPHPILTGEGADGGKSVYGEDLRGVWEAEVKRSLFQG